MWEIITPILRTSISEILYVVFLRTYYRITTIIHYSLSFQRMSRWAFIYGFALPILRHHTPFAYRERDHGRLDQTARNSTHTWERAKTFLLSRQVVDLRLSRWWEILRLNSLSSYLSSERANQRRLNLLADSLFTLFIADTNWFTGTIFESCNRVSVVYLSCLD